MNVFYAMAILWPKLKHRIPPKPYTFCLLAAALFMCLNAKGQDAPMYGSYKTSLVSLTIGDKVPESFYQFDHEAVATTTGIACGFKLDEYRNKLIIIDFWATWCGGCIYSLNKLDSIGKASKRDDFVVVPVTYQQTSVAALAWERWKWDYKAIVRDSMLGKTFPAASLPHQVWIRDGKVIAMPRHDYATTENIVKVLKGEDPASILFMQIEAGAIDPAKPAFVEGNGKTDHYYNTAYSVIAHYLPGYRHEPLQYLNIKDTTVLVASNNRISELFMDAFHYEIFPPFAKKTYKRDAVVWEITDSLRKQINSDPGLSYTADMQQDRARITYLKKNYYGYNLRYPKVINDTLARRYMQKDLNAFFGHYMGLEAKIMEQTSHTYGVLRLLGSKDEAEKLMGTGNRTRKITGESYFNFFRRPFQLLYSNTDISLFSLSDHQVTAPLVDSSGIDPGHLVSVHFPKAMRRDWTLAQINQELKRYGLMVTIESKKVPVLVLREKRYHGTN